MKVINVSDGQHSGHALGTAVRINRVWILSLREKTKGRRASHHGNRALCRSLFYCQRVCACHGRSDLNGHPVYCTNMSRTQEHHLVPRAGAEGEAFDFEIGT